MERSLVQQAMRAGEPIPDRIVNAPELHLGCELYLQAFYDLDSERTHAMGLTAISWSSMMQYAIMNDLDEEQTESLIYHVRRMDQDHLKRLAKKNKSTQTTTTAKPKRGRRGR